MRWGRRILGWVWVASVAVSSLLFVAAVAIGARSFLRNEVVTHTSGTVSTWRTAFVQSFKGRLILGTLVEWNPPWPVSRGFRMRPDQDWDAYSRPIEPGTGPTDETLFGFGVKHVRVTSPEQSGHEARAVSIPYWFIALLCLPLPLIGIRRWRKKRRLAHEGLCRVCGYDLRASVERCPECGTAIGRVPIADGHLPTGDA